MLLRHPYSPLCRVQIINPVRQYVAPAYRYILIAHEREAGSIGRYAQGFFAQVAEGIINIQIKNRKMVTV